MARRGARVLPPVGPLGSAVRSKAELGQAHTTCAAAGLRVPGDPHKAWDQAVVVGRLAELVGPEAQVLDVGCAYNRLLRNLADRGHRHLHGLDLQAWDPRADDLAHPAIQYDTGDLLAAPYRDASFDAITSLSVLEHGCPPRAYVREMARLLKPGGVLLTTTDYWRWGLATALVPRRKTFGLPWTMQTPRRLRHLRDAAAEVGLRPAREWDFATDEAAVRWNGRSYTFFAFELVKE